MKNILLIGLILMSCNESRKYNEAIDVRIKSSMPGIYNGFDSFSAPYYFYTGMNNKLISRTTFEKAELYSNVCSQRGHIYRPLCNSNIITERCCKHIYRDQIIDLDSISYRILQDQVAVKYVCDRCMHRMLKYTPKIDTIILWVGEKNKSHISNG